MENTRIVSDCAQESPRRPGGDDVEDVTVLEYLWSKEPGDVGLTRSLVLDHEACVDRSSLSQDSTSH